MNQIMQTLQKEIYESLNNDLLLKSLVTNIYSYVPQNSDFPYIVIEQIKNKSLNNLQRIGLEITVKISVITIYEGTQTFYEIIQKVKKNLSNKQFQIANSISYPFFYKMGNNIKNNDGFTLKGEMFFVSTIYNN